MVMKKSLHPLAIGGAPKDWGATATAIKQIKMPKVKQKAGSGLMDQLASIEKMLKER